MEIMVGVLSGRLDSVNAEIHRSISGVQSNILKMLNVIIVSIGDDSQAPEIMEKIRRMPNVSMVAEDGPTTPMPYEVGKPPPPFVPLSQQ